MSEARHRKFQAVVMPHLDDAYSLARGLTGNTSDAEDVVQEACVRALCGMDGFAGINARGWLLAITRNAAFTWLARNRPGRVLLASDTDATEHAMETAEDPGATPEASLIATTDARAMDVALASLSPPLREILVLREYNDLSYRDIAEILQVPVGTVMSRLARARHQLMQALTPGRIGKVAP